MISRLGRVCWLLFTMFLSPLVSRLVLLQAHSVTLMMPGTVVEMCVARSPTCWGRTRHRRACLCSRRRCKQQDRGFHTGSGLPWLPGSPHPTPAHPESGVEGLAGYSPLSLTVVCSREVWGVCRILSHGLVVLFCSIPHTFCSRKVRLRLSTSLNHLLL